LRTTLVLNKKTRFSTKKLRTGYPRLLVDLAGKSRSSQAGLRISISRVEKLVKAAVGPSLRVSDAVHVYLAGALEKTLAIVFDKAAVVAQHNRRKVVNIHSVQKALRENTHLQELLRLD
jgi:histone H3/H4